MDRQLNTNLMTLLQIIQKCVLKLCFEAMKVSLLSFPSFWSPKAQKLLALWPCTKMPATIYDTWEILSRCAHIFFCFRNSHTTGTFQFQSHAVWKKKNCKSHNTVRKFSIITQEIVVGNQQYSENPISQSRRSFEVLNLPITRTKSRFPLLCGKQMFSTDFISRNELTNS